MATHYDMAFTAADNTNILSVAPVIGANLVAADQEASLIKVLSNRGAAGDTTRSFRASLVDNPTDNYMAVYEIYRVNDSGTDFGPIARLQWDSYNAQIAGGYLARVTNNDASTWKIQLYKYSGASALTALGSAYAFTKPAIGGAASFAVQCVDDQISAWVNGQQVLTLTDATVASMNQVGFRVSGAFPAYEGVHVDRFFVTSPQGGADTQAPTVPGTPTNTATDTTSLTFSYAASTDNIAVTGYEIQATDGSNANVGAVFDNGNSLSVTLSGLSQGVTRKVQARAYDAAGNRSAWSALSAAATTTQRRFQFQLSIAQANGNIVSGAGTTSLWWAWWPSITSMRTEAAAASGTGASIDGSGVFAVSAPATLSVGDNQGILIVSNQDGTPDTAELTFVGPVTVI